MNAEPIAGDVLGGRYRLVTPIGTGGTAIVWRATDEVLARTVAIKVLAARHAGDPDSRAGIAHEARAAAALSHPHVAQVYDYGETESGMPYVVMEFVAGGTLMNEMNAGPVPPLRAMRLCAEIAEALAAAHAIGLVHRDIKPANVMLPPAGVKVVDFGIAAAVAPGRPRDQYFEVLGTPSYLAPERLIDDVVVPASDVYALGILLYRLLAGHAPWSAEDTTKMLSSHIMVAPAPLPELPGVPAEMRALCERCLRKEPEMRPSAREVAEELSAAAGSAAGSAVAGSAVAGSAAAAPAIAGASTRSGRRRLVGTVAAVVGASAVAATVATLLATGGPGGDGSSIAGAGTPGTAGTAGTGGTQAGPSAAAPASPTGTRAGASAIATEPAVAGAGLPAGPAGAQAGPAGATTYPPAVNPPAGPGEAVRTTPATSTPGANPPATAAATRTADAPAPTQQTFSSSAGDVVATCPDATTAQILSSDPVKPYKVESSDNGPGSSPAVTFKHGNSRVVVTVGCHDGFPAADIRGV